MKPRIVITKDRSPTLYLAEYDEHYHSINGAVHESMHVFINAGLKHIEKQKLSVLEIGFGTGLNALLTITENRSAKKHTDYEAVEKYPLDMSLIKQLNFPNTDRDIFLKLHSTAWNKATEIEKNFILKKRKTDLLNYSPNKKFDLVYFDAFAPNKQAELWTEEVFQKIYESMNTNGILVTYSAKGTVKQTLRNVGYYVQRLKGPSGKRHMIRAVKTH